MVPACWPVFGNGLLVHLPNRIRDGSDLVRAAVEPAVFVAGADVLAGNDHLAAAEEELQQKGGKDKYRLWEVNDPNMPNSVREKWRKIEATLARSYYLYPPSDD